MEKQYDLRELLNFIPPSSLSYLEWTNVGMALKHEGYTAADWDNWSKGDAARYHSGECFKKWETFHGSNSPITAGTIVQMAKDNGWDPPERDQGHELEWDDIIGSHKDELVIVNKSWIEGKEINEPGAEWNPVADLVKYLGTLFESSENVGYVTESWLREEDGKHLPKKGNWDRTAGELIQQLNQCKGDIGSVLGDYNPDVGAWIRFNPLDGKGAKDENVTDFRYALVEADDMDIEKQHAIIRDLELPIACLVFSGKKSIHAIVRVDAASKDEYRKRVEYLYAVCKKNFLVVDTQNKNPSRLSRMPGVTRKGHKQFLMDTNIGKESWAEWVEWIEGVNDDLPDPESMSDAWDNLPELSPPLIHGMLRQGHKMLLAGPSKAGKSYALIELCCAIAEGKKWLSWDCAQGKIMYVNLELDRASCLHRFKDVYSALGWQPKSLTNIDIWNLRGKSVPMDKLAPKLIRRAAKKNYIAIIIDPIYKVITGDENSADQMANFCNQFDMVCHELGAAVIYCHHHSKGTQGQKRSMDRASGSGVFARDPDALLDLIELDLTEDVYKQEKSKAAIRLCQQYLDANVKGWKEFASTDDMNSESAMRDYCKNKLNADAHQTLMAEIQQAEDEIMKMTAWRIDGTLREFPKFKPVNLWFDYPIHHIDSAGALKEVEAEGSAPSWKKSGKQKSKGDKKRESAETLEMAFEFCTPAAEKTSQEMADYLGISERSLRRRISASKMFTCDKGIVRRL